MSDPNAASSLQFNEQKSSNNYVDHYREYVLGELDKKPRGLWARSTKLDDALAGSIKPYKMCRQSLLKLSRPENKKATQVIFILLVLMLGVLTNLFLVLGLISLGYCLYRCVALINKMFFEKVNQWRSLFTFCMVAAVVTLSVVYLAPLAVTLFSYSAVSSLLIPLAAIGLGPALPYIAVALLAVILAALTFVLCKKMLQGLSYLSHHFDGVSFLPEGKTCYVNLTTGERCWAVPNPEHAAKLEKAGFIPFVYYPSASDSKTGENAVVSLTNPDKTLPNIKEINKHRRQLVASVAVNGASDPDEPKDPGIQFNLTTYASFVQHLYTAKPGPSLNKRLIAKNNKGDCLRGYQAYIPGAPCNRLKKYLNKKILGPARLGQIDAYVYLSQEYGRNEQRRGIIRGRIYAYNFYSKSEIKIGSPDEYQQNTCIYQSDSPIEKQHPKFKTVLSEAGRIMLLPEVSAGSRQKVNDDNKNNKYKSKSVVEQISSKFSTARMIRVFQQEWFYNGQERDLNGQTIPEFMRNLSRDIKKGDDNKFKVSFYSIYHQKTLSLFKNKKEIAVDTLEEALFTPYLAFKSAPKSAGPV